MEDPLTIGRFIQIMIAATTVSGLAHWYYYRELLKNLQSVILKYFVLVLANVTIFNIALMFGAIFLAMHLELSE